MQKILLATNGKEPAKKAEKYAINLAAEEKLPLTIIYVRDSIWYRFSEEVDWLSTHRARRDFQKYMEKYTDAEEERLFSRLEKILTEKGINFEMIALSGNPADEIVKYAKENGIDLIIIGEKEKKGFARLFGTTSAKIVKKARCKVMVVK
ncbi:MAG: universal stress protein [Nitrospirota bacterium]|jgi:nucleotide-binding universal stress UspA family protein